MLKTLAIVFNDQDARLTAKKDCLSGLERNSIWPPLFTGSTSSSLLLIDKKDFGLETVGVDLWAGQWPQHLHVIKFTHEKAALWATKSGRRIGLYVIPLNQLKNVSSVYIPASRRYAVGNSKKPRKDWTRFEGAWHLPGKWPLSQLLRKTFLSRDCTRSRLS